jgi:DNA-binding transcriptional MocR family regulator
LGIEMVTVEMRDDGPDMDAVEVLVKSDPAIKGIWCVPKYANPTGAIYSDVTVERLARMEAAAPDFRVFWDDAYAMHHLTDFRPRVMNILDACVAAGTPDRPYLFASTSKMTYPGAGLSAIAGSETNIADIARKMSFASIGPDKINQLRHVRFFGDLKGMEAHMGKHAAIIGPKFAAVEAALTRHLSGKGIAKWSQPQGGYFVSVDLLDNCASEVIRLAAEAGVVLTPAGSTFPYGKDPRDRNLRLAPTLPPLEEVEQAMEVFCACVELVSTKKRKFKV